MKKNLLFSLALAALAVSCAETPEVSPVGDPTEVTFTSKISAQNTRVTGSMFDDGDVIGVFAKDGVVNYGENVEYTFANGKFSSLSCIAYSEVGQQLDFTAMYPRIKDVTTTESFEFKTPADQSTAEAYAAADLLVASTGRTDEVCPELEFTHKLSALEINVVDSDVEVTNVRAVAQDIATCHIGSGTYEVSQFADDQEFIPYEVGDNKFAMVVAPQTINQFDVFISLNVDGVPYTWKPNSVARLQSGYKYVVNVSVKGGTIEFEGDIEPWTDGGSITGESEGGEGGEGGGGEKPDPNANVLAFEVTDLTHESLQVTTTPGSNVGNYVVGTMRDGAYEGPFQSDPVKAAQAYLDMLGYRAVDFTKANGVSIFNGPGSFYLWDVVNVFGIQTSYYVFMFALDADGNIDESFEIALDKVLIPFEEDVFFEDAQVSIEVPKVEGQNVYLTTSRTNYDGQIFVHDVAKSEFEEKFGSDIQKCAEYYVEYELAYYDAPITAGYNCYLFDEDLEEFNFSDIWWPNPSTDYIMMAVGVNTNGFICTNASYASYTTGGY